MKFILLTFITVAFLSGSIAGFAQTQSVTGNQSVPAPTAWAIASSGANSRIWQRTVYELGPNGTVITREHRFTELASGLNFWQKGQWRPSKEEIDILSDGSAVATNGQHQVGFPGDISKGVIELLTPEGKLLKSRPIGLFFEDDNGSALVALVTNSVGELVGSNLVVYPDAFEGVTASIRYRYTRAGFEQDVMVQGQLPDPAALGLNPARTRLGVLTEFFDTNNPVETTSPTDPQTGLSDTTLDFGMMTMEPGRAFVIGDINQSDQLDEGTPTYKRWLNLNGHKFLMEEVPYPRVAPQLERLPMSGRANIIATNLFAANSILNRVSARQGLSPVPGIKSANRNQKSKVTRRLAQTGRDQSRALVLDYVTLNTSLTNQIFQGDSTYYISGNVTLAGTNYFEGGAVVKFARGKGITVATAAIANWLGGAYRPVVFSAVDDNAVGETISGSSGSPSGYYANAAVSFSDANIPTLSNLRIAYAQTGVLTSSGSASPTLYNAQFINCQYGAQFSGSAAYLRNVLFANVLTNFVNLSASKVNLQNVTLNNVISLSTVASGTPTLYLTNCILAKITNNGSASVAGCNNGFYSSTAFGTVQYTTSVLPFQTVGAGSYYLTASNPFRNVGTTNIDSWLLADLATKTTYPPIVYSNTTISVATTFSPQAQRDNNKGPDLGYHYDPLDYVFGGVNVYSNLTFTAGTAVGYFELPGSGGPGYGISIFDNVVLALNGTASQPCTVARYSTVQEGGTGLWKDKGWLAAIAGQSLSGGYGMNPANAAQVWPNFTRHAALAGDPPHYREYSALLKVAAQNSEFWGSGVGAYWEYLNFTNCLFDRAGFGNLGGNPAICGMRNCTMHGGSITLYKYGLTWPVWIEECAFDGTTFSVDDNSGGNTNITYCDFNAFLTNGQRLPMLGTHDVTNLLSFNWQSSWFGNYYQSTNSPLINHGSTTADQFGLYHFTILTNQVPETNSIVDIGYHYVATDAYGNPLDTNGDGIPDYLEDANGNGLVDSGEIGWNIFGDPGLSVIITRPRNGSSLP